MSYRDDTSRRVIDVAIGILVGLRGCSDREAFDELVQVVHQTGIGIGRLAAGLVALASGSATAEHASVIIGKLLEKGDANQGFDAQTGNYTDMVKAGIIDPTKVVRLALQGAASVAALLITTEVMVGEAPEKKVSQPMPGGGMGGMDY